jgi:hypothetical protein
MEEVEYQIGYGAYHIYLPRNYTIKNIPIRYGTIYNIISLDNNIENIHGEIYIGTDQRKKEIKLDNNKISENVKSKLMDKNIIWPIYYVEEIYYTVLIVDIPGGLYRLIRLVGKEKTKENILNLINIFSTFDKNTT